MTRDKRQGQDKRLSSPIGELTGKGPRPPAPPAPVPPSPPGGQPGSSGGEPARLALPRSVARRAGAGRGSAHPGLAFDKFVAGWSPDWQLEVQDRQNPKRDFLRAFAADYKKNPARTLYEASLARRDAFYRLLGSQGWIVLRERAETQWRLVTGLGTAHPFETGFILDRSCGVPFLPGSSLKGAARSWAEQAGGAWTSATLAAVFGPLPERETGGPEPSQGGVVFFDAYPGRWPELAVDVLNPHYKDYYEDPDRAAPADYLSPTPIFFLTVAPGQPFEFAVAVREKVRSSVLEEAGVADTQGLARLGLTAVVGAARELGLGGKTAVGYGYFTPTK